MATYDYALGFEAWTGPAEKLPPQPMEPLPPSPEATASDGERYARALSEHAEAKRKYEAELNSMTDDDANWSEQRTPLPGTKDEAAQQVKEFAALHQTNPLVRNVGLYRTPTVKWERVQA